MENSVKNETNEFKPEIGYSAKKFESKCDVGFQIEKNKKKIKCQINESAQVTDESNTDNEDLTKVKTKETETAIFPKITIMGSRPSKSPKITIMGSRQSRSKKTREYDSDSEYGPPRPSRPLRPSSRLSRLSRLIPLIPLSPLKPLSPLTPLERCSEVGRRLSLPDHEHHAPHGTPPYRCSSSDNNETHISRMDKIIAQGNVPFVPGRNRPAPPPPDVLD